MEPSCGCRDKSEDKNNGLKIAITCSIKPKDLSEEEEERYAEFDSEETIDDLKEAIASSGYETIIIDTNRFSEEALREELKRKKEDISLIFNVAEGMSGEDRESLVPKICEDIGIPFTAAASKDLMITLNKSKTKDILKKNSIPTPRFQVFEDADETIQDDLAFPLIVKPLLEGSSKGLFNENLVNDKEELKRIVKKTITDYSQPALVEEFLEGREFTVSIIGCNSPAILPIVEIRFDHLPKNIHPMDSYEAKWVYDSPEFIEKSGFNPIVCPANISKELETSIKDVALKSFRALNCRDWARVDIRLDRDNIPNVLEANALPGFMKDPKKNSRLPKAAYAAGWSYEKLIKEVIRSAMERWGIKR
ncbi:ATP-grasp domain-containing protein [Candidatus Woesearchaeota archaeon]|nr:ATP-grasp domain-containing protein [Candidatus Woesearchaeota archaeon]